MLKILTWTLLVAYHETQHRACDLDRCKTPISPTTSGLSTVKVLVRISQSVYLPNLGSFPEDYALYGIRSMPPLISDRWAECSWTGAA